MPEFEIEQKEIKKFYIDQKPQIKKRLKEFNGLWNTKNNEKLFAELCFCLLTPQSKARICWAAVNKLIEKDLLFNGSARQISGNMIGVRFMNNKARYIVKARKQFAEIKKAIKKRKNVPELRDRLVKSVCGIGYKEASHFLRNIGLGTDIAILDRHILKNLKLIGVINEIPATITKKKYFEIEEKMKEFSRNIKIPIADLDLLMWAKETGNIFK